MRRALLCCLVILLGCGGSESSGPVTTPVSDIPLSTTLESASLSAPVDVVRDEWGIPHIYGSSLADIAYAQGYVSAQDRLVQMDFLRRNAEGTLAELVGGLSPAAVDADIQMRVHHLRATAQESFDILSASGEPNDQELLGALAGYAAGVNAYVADLQAGVYELPTELMLLYNPAGFRPWNEVDSLLMLNFMTFFFNFSADAEIGLTALKEAAASAFDESTDPAHLARAGIYGDFVNFAPVDPTYTIQGWTGLAGGGAQAALPLGDADGNLQALLAADATQVRGVARDWRDFSTTASNNWVVGPALTQNGHVLLANDTHVPLQNPPFWYLVQLVNTGDKPFRAMGEAAPGLPSIVLGMNDHIAWGATTDQMDQTDVYQETVVTCDGSTDPCVLFNGAKVPLVPRTETFGVGTYGTIDHEVTVTFYDVPHHGPIIPRVTADHDLEPLGSTELSVRYVGYEPTTLVRVAFATLYSKTAQELMDGLARDNQTAAFNWVVGDDQGNFGWTEVVRMPRRAADHEPWLVLPGDGTAEWGVDLDPKYIPHAVNPAQGFLATANADPIGVTDDGDPFFDEPIVDGAPLYLTWNYVDGCRVGRITKRLEAAKAAGTKLTLDDMQSIQADTISEYGQLLTPTLLEAFQALREELATAGTHPELTAMLAAADAATTADLEPAETAVKGWTFDTPAAVDEDNPTPQAIADSQATLVFQTWMDRFIHRAFDDERAELSAPAWWGMLVKLIIRASTQPETLATGVSADTGDALLFDDMSTTAVESKLQIAAQALLDALAALNDNPLLGPDPAAWRWGRVHTVTLDFLTPMDMLKIPLKSDPDYPNGFPRHGGAETVDPGGGIGDYTYGHGPGIRFVVELDPEQGPIARNVLPGGETFDPTSPHYRDQMELWRKNQAFDLAWTDAQVLASAQTEYAQNAIGRVRFQPKKK